MTTSLLEITVIMTRDTSHNDVTHHHTQSSDHKEDTSPPCIHEQNGWQSEYDIDNTQYTSG